MAGVRNNNKESNQERLTVLVSRELCARIRAEAALRNMRVGPFVRQLLTEKMADLDQGKVPDVTECEPTNGGPPAVA